MADQPPPDRNDDAAERLRRFYEHAAALHAAAKAVQDLAIERQQWFTAIARSIECDAVGDRAARYALNAIERSENAERRADTAQLRANLT